MSASKTIKNIEFFGKHAEIIEKISVTQDNTNTLEYNKPPLFNRILDSMFLAGMIGLLSKRKGIKDTTSAHKKTIFSETVYNNINDINFYSAMPMIKERDLSKTIEVKRALFTEGEENFLDYRLNYFYSYVLGGLEIIDEKVLKFNDADDDIAIYERLEDLINCLTENIASYSIDVDVDLDLDLDFKVAEDIEE